MKNKFKNLPILLSVALCVIFTMPLESYGKVKKRMTSIGNGSSVTSFVYSNDKITQLEDVRTIYLTYTDESIIITKGKNYSGIYSLNNGLVNKYLESDGSYQDFIYEEGRLKSWKKYDKEGHCVGDITFEWNNGVIIRQTEYHPYFEELFCVYEYSYTNDPDYGGAIACFQSNSMFYDDLPECLIVQGYFGKWPKYLVSGAVEMSEGYFSNLESYTYNLDQDGYPLSMSGTDRATFTWENIENNFPESISLNIEISEIAIGESIQLTATLEPQDPEAEIVWSSNNPEVAEVTNGLVQGLSVGKAIITASYEDLTAECEISVYEPIINPENITLNIKDIQLNYGDKYQLIATIEPENTTDKAILWESSNEDVAYVSNTGLVIGLYEGTATITASCGLVTSSCEVTVLPNFNVPEEILVKIKEAQLTIGDYLKIESSVNYDNEFQELISLNSSNPEVVRIDAEGLVTAISEGTATITATYGDLSTSFEVNVLGYTNIESLPLSLETIVTVYNTSGIIVNPACKINELNSLAKGVYIIYAGGQSYKIAI